MNNINCQDSSHRDTFGVDELSKRFEEEKNREASYEIISQSMKNGNTVNIILKKNS